MIVRWTARARTDLRGIHGFIAAESPGAAVRVVEGIVANTRQLSRFPESGRIVPESLTRDIREVVASPYRILYSIRVGTLYILAIIHDKQSMAAILKARGEE